MESKKLEKECEQKIETNNSIDVNFKDKIIEDLIIIYEEFFNKEKNSLISEINNKLKKFKMFEEKEKLIEKKYINTIKSKKEKLKNLIENNNNIKNKLLDFLNKKNN